MSETRDQILDKLYELGVESLEVSYEGYGDSGGVEYFNVKPEGIDLNIPSGAFHKQALWDKGKVIKHIDVELSLEDHITDYIYDTLNANLGGWEINEGSNGLVRFHPDTGRIQIEHNNNFTVEHDETYEGKITLEVAKLEKQYTTRLTQLMDKIRESEVQVLSLAYGYGEIESVEIDNGREKKEIDTAIEDKLGLEDGAPYTSGYDALCALVDHLTDVHDDGGEEKKGVLRLDLVNQAYTLSTSNLHNEQEYEEIVISEGYDDLDARRERNAP